MLLKSVVFALVPLSTRLKFARGEGDAVNEKENELSGVACLMIVIEPGKMTAAAESERSWLPPAPSRSTSAVWYGEPAMATAELFAPQLRRVEMCADHASTGFATVLVNVMAMLADLSPAKPAPSG